MFDTLGSMAREAAPPTGAVMRATRTDEQVLRAADVDAARRALLDGALPGDDAERVDLLRALEELKSTAAAVQASTALAVDAAARAADARRGLPPERRGRDVAVRLGLALRESPARARSFLGAARVWHTEMPHTLAALRAGHLSAWRATVLVKETAHLPVEARSLVDAETCARPEDLDGLGTAALAACVRRRAAELDPAAVAERARRAAAERSVWIRPAPDTMTYVTALLPVAQGVGVYAALRRAADSARATGDERSRGQVMADTLVERLTGQSSAEAVPVAVNLVVSDATLLGGGHEAATVLDGAGGGPAGAGGVVPAQVARNLVANGLDTGAAWVRRLYADRQGRLVGVSSTGRFFADGLAALLRVRDQGLCRTPYCDAPIWHLDHVVPVASGGPTAPDNGQGLCEACNLAKNARELRQVVEERAGRHVVTTTTSTGHRYRSTAPPPPRPATTAPSTTRGSPGTAMSPVQLSPPGAEASLLEARLAVLVETLRLAA